MCSTPYSVESFTVARHCLILRHPFLPMWPPLTTINNVILESG